MPPNKKEPSFEVTSIKELSTVPVPPAAEQVQIPTIFTGGYNIRLPLNTGTTLDVYFEPLPPPEFYSTLNISIENNLKNLLQEVTGLDNVQGVTTLKLKVITHDLCLQNLSLYMPILQELDLTGSSVSSLRDLGCGLKKLRILKINYCGISVLDGLFGLQTLREIHAGHNLIKDLGPCSFLPDIEKIDMSYNQLQDINTLSFLTLCTKLKHMVLKGNRNFYVHPEYRSFVKKTLKGLETLDEIPFKIEQLPTNKAKLPVVKSKDEKREENLKLLSGKEGMFPPIVNNTKRSGGSPKNKPNSSAN